MVAGRSRSGEARGRGFRDATDPASMDGPWPGHKGLVRAGGGPASGAIRAERAPFRVAGRRGRPDPPEA